MVEAPFTIGADPDQWPGVAKLLEECGEVGQVAAKLLAFPDGAHPDGDGPLAERFADELADLLAAVMYVRAHARQLVPLQSRIDDRMDAKFLRFQRWHGQAYADAARSAT